MPPGAYLINEICCEISRVVMVAAFLLTHVDSKPSPYPICTSTLSYFFLERSWLSLRWDKDTYMVCNALSPNSIIPSLYLW